MYLPTTTRSKYAHSHGIITFIVLSIVTAAQKGTLNTMVIVPEKFSALGAVK